MTAQLLCHLFGDYILQSSWMANNKMKRWIPAIAHAITYLIPFLIIIQPSVNAAVVITLTHLLIDRFRLARYIAYANNFLAPISSIKSWGECRETGYFKDTPPFLGIWLMIIVDNTIHLAINAFAIAYL